MAAKLRVYVEVGPKRAFACAVEWPGWCRAGRDAESAIEALIAYGGRYREALGPAATGLTLPLDSSGLQVVHRLKGNATTEFGAPGITAPSDRRPIDAVEVKRVRRLLQAAWTAFERTAVAAESVVLDKSHHGCGRSLWLMMIIVGGVELAVYVR